MDFEEAYKVADAAVFLSRNKHLTDAEATVLRGAWHSQSYDAIADGSSYSLNYLKRDVGPRLWRELSAALKESVGKTNFREALERFRQVKGAELDQFVPSPVLSLPASLPLSATVPSGSPTSQPLRKDWGEAIDTKTGFHGRQEELTQLKQWILEEDCRLVSLVGCGGVGKTALATELAHDIKDQFEYFIWRSLRHQPPIESILKEIIEFITTNDRDAPEEESYRHLNAGLSTLLDLLRKKRCLIVLDSVEVLLQEGERSGRYLTQHEGYGELFTRVGVELNRSCVVITSREKPKEFTPFEGERLPVRSFQVTGLDEATALQVLRDKGLTEPEAECKRLIRLYSGNPYMLKIAATTIQTLLGGDIAGFLAQDTLVFDGIQRLIQKQLDRLSRTEKQLVYWLAIHREPVSPLALREATVSPMFQANLLEALYALERRSLIEKSDTDFSTFFTLQPALREAVTNRFIETICEEIGGKPDSEPVRREPEAIVASIHYLNSHALIQATTKDYIRDDQIHCILEPIAERLQSQFGTPQAVSDRLMQIAQAWRQRFPRKWGYVGGNILNLLHQLGDSELNGKDFSQLTLRQAYLQTIQLQQTNFKEADLSDSRFTEVLGIVWSVAFSPNGQRLAAGDDNGQISFWEVKTGKKIEGFVGHDSWIRSVAFSSDGQWLASASQDQTVRLWHVETRQCDTFLAPDANGSTLGPVSHKDWVRCVQFHPTQPILASCSDDYTVKLWNLTDRTLRQVLPCECRIRSIAFSPDGRWLAGGGDDAHVWLWPLDQSAEVQSPGSADAPLAEKLQGHDAWVRSVAFSPDGQWLASSSNDCTIRLWNLTTRACVRVLEGHAGWVRTIAFSSDGRWLASGSDDRRIRLWEVATGICQRCLENQGLVLSVAFQPSLPDAQPTTVPLLASGGDDQTVRLWEVETGQRFRTHQGYTTGVRSIVFVPNRPTLISGGNDQQVRLWDLQTGTHTILATHERRVWSVAISPKGQFFASAGDDQEIRLQNFCTGELFVLSGHNHSVRCLVFHPTEPWLASSSFDRTIQLWNASTGACLRTLQGHQHWVRSIAFSPDGQQLASVDDNQQVFLWNLDERPARPQELGKHEHRVRAVAFSPDGTWLATASDDKMIKLWTRSGKYVKTLAGHRGGVQSIVFTMDSQFLISGSDDHTVRRWAIETGTNEILYEHENWVRSVAISQDGKTLASGGNDKRIQLYDLEQSRKKKVLKLDSPYEGMDITGVTGLTLSRQETLLNLGAIDHSRALYAPPGL